MSVAPAMVKPVYGALALPGVIGVHNLGGAFPANPADRAAGESLGRGARGAADGLVGSGPAESRHNVVGRCGLLGHGVFCQFLGGALSSLEIVACCAAMAWRA